MTAAKEPVVFKITDYIERDLAREEEECRRLGVAFAAYQLKSAAPAKIVEAVKDADVVLVNMAAFPAAVVSRLKRVKLICSRLGLDVSGELDLAPSSIKGRTCNVTVEVEEYKDSEGKTKKRNVVPFAGYEKADESAADPYAENGEGSGSEDSGEESLPF